MGAFILTHMLTNPLFYILMMSIAVGAWFLVRRSKPALPVLRFEKVGIPPVGSALKNEWISPLTLDLLFQFLSHRNFTSVSPQELSSPLPARPVWLVFMGGYRSFYTDVFPLLKKYNLKATVFLAADLIGTYNAWQDPHKEPWQDLMSAVELTELKQSGLVSFGALPLQTEIGAFNSEQNIIFLLRESAHRLAYQQRLTVQAFSSYPAGITANQMQTILSNVAVPFVTLQERLNSLPLEKNLFTSLTPSKRPIYTRLLLWKLR